MARILVDMDGVLANWGLQYDRDLAAWGEPAAGIPRTADQRTFDLYSGRTEQQREIIAHVMNRPGFYADLQPIDGALAAVREMVEAGHDVHLCTTPTAANPTCIPDKLAWVNDHLGKEWLPRVTFTHDKAAVVGDILIDDRPDIPGGSSAAWTQVFFTQPYNFELFGPRINRWEEWRRVVGDVLAARAPVQPSASGEVRKVSVTGGEKGAKPQRYDLIPVAPLDKLAELYAAGASKYADHNWRRGYEWSLSYAAAMRHMTRFWAGEDIDPEMGLPHPIAAAFHMFALVQFLEDFPELDDRFKPSGSSLEQRFDRAMEKPTEWATRVAAEDLAVLREHGLGGKAANA